MIKNFKIKNFKIKNLSFVSVFVVLLNFQHTFIYWCVCTVFIWVEVFKNWPRKICEPYRFNFFNSCLPQIWVGPFFNTLTHIMQHNLLHQNPFLHLPFLIWESNLSFKSEKPRKNEIAQKEKNDISAVELQNPQFNRLIHMF